MSSSFSMANGVVIVTKVYPQETGTARTIPGRVKASTMLDTFLKGQPKALGTVQIMIGVVEILFGIVMYAYVQIYADLPAYSGITLWGALVFIISGALSVAASEKLNGCLVKGALGMNIFSTITAGIAIILHCLDLALENSHYSYSCVDDFYMCIYKIRTYWMIGVLLVFSFLEFIVSISVSAFACRAVYSSTSEKMVVMQHPSFDNNTIPPESLPIPTQADEVYETISPRMAQKQPDVFIKSDSENSEEYVTFPP